MITGRVLRSLFMLLAVAVLLFVGYVYLQREQNAAQEIRGAITLRRLLCKPSTEQGIYQLTIVAQNTTDSTLNNLTARLTMGRGEELIHKTVDLGHVERRAFVEIDEEVPVKEKPQVCFARFYVGDTMIPSRFRP